MNRQNTVADVLVHTVELEERSEYAPAISPFLTASEQAVLWQRVRFPHRLFFWGGFSEAERRAAVFLPEWAADGAPYGSNVRWDSPEREDHLRGLIFNDGAPFEDISKENIVLLQIVGSGHRELSHRDVLGSLMGLGVTRQSAGDICMVSSSEAVVAITGKLTEYVCKELTKVATDAVTVYPVKDPSTFIFKRKFEESSVTVSSMRLDCVVSAVTGLSRTKASEHIEAGLVQLSGIVEDKVSAEINDGDIVTVRGFGKFLIKDTGTLSRKSKLRLLVKKYV